MSLGYGLPSCDASPPPASSDLKLPRMQRLTNWEEFQQSCGSGKQNQCEAKLVRTCRGRSQFRRKGKWLGIQTFAWVSPGGTGYPVYGLGGDKPLQKSAVVERAIRQTHQYSHLTGERIQWDTHKEVCTEDEVPRHLRSSWDPYRTVF